MNSVSLWVPNLAIIVPGCADPRSVIKKIDYQPTDKIDVSEFLQFNGNIGYFFEDSDFISIIESYS